MVKPDLERIWSMIISESGEPQAYWFLSFANEQGFLGATCVRAGGMASALRRTHELGINPGGSVAYERLTWDNAPPEMDSKLETNKDRAIEIMQTHVRENAS